MRLQMFKYHGLYIYNQLSKCAFELEYSVVYNRGIAVNIDEGIKPLWYFWNIYVYIYALLLNSEQYEIGRVSAKTLSSYMSSIVFICIFMQVDQIEVFLNGEQERESGWSNASFRYHRE